MLACVLVYAVAAIGGVGGCVRTPLPAITCPYTRSSPPHPPPAYHPPNRWADHIIALLPWEAEEEGHAILTQPLMEHVLSLPLDEANFAPLTEAERAQFPFKLENHVDVITRLLQLDPNLGKVREEGQLLGDVE